MIRWFVVSVMVGVCVGGAFAAKPRRGAKEAAQPAAVAQETTLAQQLSAEVASKEEGSALDWYDAGLLTLEGRGYNDTLTTYTRLPTRAEGKVPPAVWHLSKQSAGLVIRFATDSTTIGAVWRNGFKMSHMARTGSSGLDLYAREGNEWVFCGVGKPAETTRTVAVLTRGRPGVMTQYMLNLPLYDETTELKIGVAPGSVLAPMTPRQEKPIVFYGTSITQGGCASRSGMAHVSILGRWLNRPVINLGFSGSGKSEPEMQELVNEIDAAVFVLEPLPNMTVDNVRERIPGFVKTLRKKHPNTPILLVENPNLSTTSTQNMALRAIFDQARKQGTRRLHYLYAEAQLAGRENGTVDGVHPTDLGYQRMASVYEPMIKMMLGEK